MVVHLVEGGLTKSRVTKFNQVFRTRKKMRRRFFVYYVEITGGCKITDFAEDHAIKFKYVLLLTYSFRWSINRKLYRTLLVEIHEM